MSKMYAYMSCIIFNFQCYMLLSLTVTGLSVVVARIMNTRVMYVKPPIPGGSCPRDHDGCCVSAGRQMSAAVGQVQRIVGGVLIDVLVNVALRLAVAHEHQPFRRGLSQPQICVLVYVCVMGVSFTSQMASHDGTPTFFC